MLSGNLNANRAIVTAAVMYVLRTLIAEDIPLNQGVLAPVRIVLPECLLNPTAGRYARDESWPLSSVATSKPRSAWSMFSWARLP